MNSHGLALGIALSALAVATAAGQPQAFTAGNLVLLQVGDGSATVTSVATPVFLKEFTPEGAFVQTIAMPTAIAGANRRLMQSGSATSEGFLTRSVDERFLFLVGYDAEAGTANIASSASSTVNRVVGRVAADGTVDTTTAVSDTVNGNIRSATSTNGTDIWIASNGSTTVAGVRYMTLGAPGNTSIPISNVGTSVTSNVRVINIFNDRLYVSASSGAFQGVGTVGPTPPPVTGPQDVTLLPGFPNSGASAYDFYFADANTLYVADDRTIVNGGGIYKWVFNPVTELWAAAYVMNTGFGNNGPRSITGKVDSSGVVTLYLVTAGTASAGSAFGKVVDTGAASEFTTIVSAAPAVWYKGIDWAPVDTVQPPACYANCDGSTVAPILNVADFTCFLQKFAAGDAYANCDGSTVPPVLNVADFTCFLQKFAAGCN